jgi:hypothetical protein
MRGRYENSRFEPAIMPPWQGQRRWNQRASGLKRILLISFVLSFMRDVNGLYGFKRLQKCEQALEHI